MSDLEREITPRQEFIKSIFGRLDRVDIWEAVSGIEPPESFRTFDLAISLAVDRGVPAANVQLELGAMLRWGMIVRVNADPSDSRSVYYQKAPSPVWDIAEVAVSSVNVLFPEITEG